MKFFFTLLFILLSFSAMAETSPSWIDGFTFRAGLSFERIEIRTSKLIDNHESTPDDPEDEARTFGFGGVTSIQYRLGNWEFGVGSDVVFGRIKDTSFISNGGTIRGEGTFRLVSVGPVLKYFTPWTLLNYANFYVGAGPSWSLQTYVFSNPNTTGNFNAKKRIAFENIGGGLFFGLEQITTSKTDHPIFLEVGYSYMHSYKVSILDASKSADVITLSEGESNDFSAQYLIVRMGAALF